MYLRAWTGQSVRKSQRRSHRIGTSSGCDRSRAPLQSPVRAPADPGGTRTGHHVYRGRPLPSLVYKNKAHRHLNHTSRQAPLRIESFDRPQ